VQQEDVALGRRSRSLVFSVSPILIAATPPAAPD